MRALAPQPRFRRRGALLAVFAGLVLVVAIPASASAAAFTAHLSAPNHRPTANKKWPITVTVKRGHTRLSGSVKYQFLFDGAVEATRPGHSFKKGVYHDALVFPDAAVGHTLSLHVIVSTRYGTVTLPWWVQARS